MSRVLPSDCVNLILSHLPLEQFNKYDLFDKYWKARFFCRYHQPLNGTRIKRNYLLRAATEYSEVCVATLNLYDGRDDSDSELCESLIYYYAARAGNWKFVRRCITDDFDFDFLAPEIFALAISASQIDIAKYLINAGTDVTKGLKVPVSAEILQLLIQHEQLSSNVDLRSYLRTYGPYEKLKSWIYGLPNLDYLCVYLPNPDGCDYQRKVDYIFNLIHNDNSKEIFYNQVA